MEQRKISVGLVKPTELNGNDIYVQLTQVNGGLVRANAISAVDFNYVEYCEGKLCRGTGKKVNNSYNAPHPLPSSVKDYNEFISMIAEENSAEVGKDRFKEDGLSLKENLTEILEGTNKVGKSLLNLPGKLNLDNF